MDGGTNSDTERPSTARRRGRFRSSSAISACHEKRDRHRLTTARRKPAPVFLTSCPSCPSWMPSPLSLPRSYLRNLRTLWISSSRQLLRQLFFEYIRHR